MLYLEDQSRVKTTLAYQKAFDDCHKNYDGMIDIINPETVTLRELLE